MGRKTRKILALFLAFMMMFSVLPVGQMEAVAATSKVKYIKLNKTQYVLAKGEKVTLKATVSPGSVAKKYKVTWKTSNKKVAVVSSKGVVTAKATKGTATITATAGGKKASCKIIIGKAVKSISASNISIYAGSTKKISAKLSPSNAKIKTLTYKSSNTKVATVSKSGIVTGKKAGTANITIYAADRAKYPGRDDNPGGDNNR